MSPAATLAGPTVGALEVLFDSSLSEGGHARGGTLPPGLERRYGGPLTVPLRGDRPTFIANFVSTLDGVVALGSDAGGGVISGFHEPDRFVMSLLRCLADVVVVGAGTLRGSTDHRWTPDHLQPGLADDFAEWRRAMDLAPQPTTVIVTGSGDLPVDHPGLNQPGVPVVIATTTEGVRRLRERGVAPSVWLEAVAEGGPLTGTDILGVVSTLGARLALVEGGPHLMAELVAADVLDELFLTVAPQLVGRGHVPGDRLGLVEGLALSPSAALWQTLVSVRRSGSHLFLRHRRNREPRRLEES